MAFGAAPVAVGVDVDAPGAHRAASALTGAEHPQALAVAVDGGVDDRSPGERVGLLGAIAGHVLDRVADDGIGLFLGDKQIGEDDVDAGLDKGALLDNDGGGFVADQHRDETATQPLVGRVVAVAAAHGLLDAQGDVEDGVLVDDGGGGVVQVQVEEENVGALLAEEKRDTAADVTGHHAVELHGVCLVADREHAATQGQMGGGGDVLGVELGAVEPVFAISAVLLGIGHFENKKF